MGTGSKGGKTRKRGKNSTEGTSFKRELITKEEGQEYGVVTKMLGNGRLEAYCYDGKTRMCHIRGKMRKKVWVNQGDTVLIGLRDYQDDKADVIHKYNPDEARQLKKMGELPDSAEISENTGPDEGEGEEEGGLSIEFDDL
jgi:translation initiation factor 1A